MFEKEEVMLSIENHKVNKLKFLDLLTITTIFYFITTLTLSALTPESNLPEFLRALPQKSRYNQ